MNTSPLSKAFLCRRLTAPIEVELRCRYTLIINEDDRILGPDEIVRRAEGVEVLFVTATERIDSRVLRALSTSLKSIATLSVGYDHIDLESCRSLGIKVVHTPDVLSEACAEIAMLLVLNACRRGFEADRMVRTGAWNGWAPTQLLGRGLVGRRPGILGMGRIGRAIAARAHGFGMHIHYHNRNRLPCDLELGAKFHPTLEAMLECAEVLVIAAPGSPQSNRMLNHERIAMLPAGAVVVNISRGDLVDDDALIDGLNRGHVFAAGLDVFANEPRIDPRYRQMDNVFLTPHIGSATHETRDAMGWMLIRGLEALSRGDVPTNLLSQSETSGISK